jgi:hypothetical protein
MAGVVDNSSSSSSRIIAAKGPDAARLSGKPGGASNGWMSGKATQLSSNAPEKSAGGWNTAQTKVKVSFIVLPSMSLFVELMLD